jgi:hypothetical protein
MGAVIELIARCGQAWREQNVDPDRAARLARLATADPKAKDQHVRDRE